MSCTTTQAINHKSSQQTPSALDPLSANFGDWGRCQLSGWWRRTGHTVSHLAFLAICLIKSSETPAALPTDGFLDRLQSSEQFWERLSRFSLDQACESWKMLVLARGEVMWTLPNDPSRMTFSLEVIMVLSVAAFVSIQTNYIREKKQTHTHSAAKSCFLALTVKD